MPNASKSTYSRRRFFRHFLASSMLAALWPSARSPSAVETPVKPAGAINTNQRLEPSLLTPGNGFKNYGQPSVYEKKVIRWISNNSDMPTNGVSWTPLHDLTGTITPNGLHFERHHNGVPNINPDQHSLLVDGPVPRRYSMNDLMRYRFVHRHCFVECGGNSNAGWNPRPLQVPAGYMHGLVSCSQWSGVLLADILDQVGISDEHQNWWLDAQGGDAGAFHVSIPVSKALDDALIAIYQNGERLRPENGYPLRLILPGFEAVTHVKWLRQLRLVPKPVMARDETSKYTEIQPGGIARQFTFVMAPKSIILTPSPGKTMYGPGWYNIRGLAWSGHGAIAAVEISVDNGQNWVQAQLEEPVRKTCFTSFHLAWHWQGDNCVIQSRARDDKGLIQPERADLIAKRGQFGYFHYNAIIRWQLSEQGQISHVY